MIDKTFNILVTGGAGFIGSALISRLNDLGYNNITIVDRLGKTDKWRNLVGLRYLEYIEAKNFSLLLSELKSHDLDSPWDIIFHLGACSSTREIDASYLIQNNCDTAIYLASYAIEHDVRFIYASSAATYGLSANQSDDLSPDLLRPVNPYGLSKNIFDQYAKSYGWLDKIVGLKYFNVWGPNCEHKGVMKSFVTRAYEEIKTTGKVTMFDTYKDVPEGQDARDFLYIDDAVSMTLYFAFDEKGVECAGLFNLGSGIATSWKDMALATIMATSGPCLDYERKIVYKNLPSELKGKYQYYTKADISKLRSTGYNKQIWPVDIAVNDYVLNYLVPDLRIGEKKILDITTNI